MERKRNSGEVGLYATNPSPSTRARNYVPTGNMQSANGVKGWINPANRGRGKGYQGTGRGYKGNGKGYQGNGRGYQGTGKGYQGSGKGYQAAAPAQGNYSGWVWHGKGKPPYTHHSSYLGVEDNMPVSSASSAPVPPPPPPPAPAPAPAPAPEQAGPPTEWHKNLAGEMHEYLVDEELDGEQLSHSFQGGSDY
jgi:hypothetical protein